MKIVDSGAAFAKALAARQWLVARLPEAESEEDSRNGTKKTHETYGMEGTAESRSSRIKPNQTKSNLSKSSVFEVQANQAQSDSVKPLGWKMGLALILTFSPWEKEQQGSCSECRTSWLGQPVKVCQTESGRRKGMIGQSRLT